MEEEKIPEKPVDNKSYNTLLKIKRPPKGAIKRRFYNELKPNRGNQR